MFLPSIFFEGRTICFFREFEVGSAISSLAQLSSRSLRRVAFSLSVLILVGAVFEKRGHSSIWEL
jgi:hypothetical protein